MIADDKLQRRLCQIVERGHAVWSMPSRRGYVLSAGATYDTASMLFCTQNFQRLVDVVNELERLRNEGTKMARIAMQYAAWQRAKARVA